MLLGLRKRGSQEFRTSPRLPAGYRVEIGWEGQDRYRVDSGRCLDISEGGARIELAETVPVCTEIHLRFLDNLNFEADGVVRHSTGRGFIGVEFTRMLFCGSLVRHSKRWLPGKLGTPIVVISAFLILFAWLTDILPKWRPFTSRSSPAPMNLSGPTFTLGSSRAAVQMAQGPPTLSSGTAWSYGASRVYFQRDRVVGWSSSPQTPLKVGAKKTETPADGKQVISKGSSAADVLAVEGPPEELTATVWRYADSEIYFRDGRVVGWKSSPARPLAVTAR